MMQRNSICLSVMAVCCLSAGCSSLHWPNVWPFPEVERTTYRTPAMRVDAIQQFATRATGVDTPEQRELTDQLARQIQIEPDPIVRQAVVVAIAEFRTPIAQQVLEAGLDDSNRDVRLASCNALGKRAEETSIPRLADALRSDKDIDVRLAAAKALGNIKSPQSVEALVVALDDRDPAMQYVGVQSMKSITGKDYGGDVSAWRQVATGGQPPPQKVPTVAERLRRVSPF